MTENKLIKINSFLKKLELGSNKKLNLEEENMEKIKHLINSFQLQNLLQKLSDPDYTNKIDYSNLSEISDMFNLVTREINYLKNEVDIFEFHKRGDIFNFKKLKKDFKIKKLNEKFPDFNFDKYEELFKNPPLELKNYRNQKISFDEFFIRKLLIAIHQMIFSEMDLRIINTGKEGSGKSCFASQIILYAHWFLYEVGLIKYEFDVTKIFYSSVVSMLQAQDEQEDTDYFRIMCLDEGYELNRQNFREETSKLYKDSMRSDRKMLRIELINLPQIGELETAITSTRTNFIFFTDMDSDLETGTVKKGNIDMYIIPRGKKIYSPYQRRNIPDYEITNEISRILKDKNDSYKGLPKSCLIKRFEFEGIWGFNKDKYDKFIKKENRKRRYTDEVRTSERVAWILFRKLPKISNWGTFDMKDSMDKTMYHTIQKWIKKSIEKRFVENPEILNKYEVKGIVS